jgi:hypothetical protein
MGSRVFTRHVLLDRWFLRAHATAAHTVSRRIG